MSASPLITGNPYLPSTPYAPTARNHAIDRYAIEFTGSGSEYFRIWIVNLLLMVLTLGLYYPWAKVRKLRYFYGNTLVAGHPLDFHGNPAQMLRGFLLVTVLMVLYSVAGKVSSASGAIAAVILALVWPALMRASMQFRLANTSWRGLRFTFTGSLKDAYMVVFMPVLAFIGLTLVGIVSAALLPETLRQIVTIAGGALMAIGAMAMGPYVWWRLKAYQHTNYALGTLQTQFKATYGDTIGVFLRTGLIGIVSLVIAAITAGLLASASGASLPDPADKKGMATIVKLVLPALFMVFMLAQLVQTPYFVSRMQNLIWTQTGNRQVRFKSHLELRPLLWLTLKNWALMILTLGLYWPFAAVALARIKLQAIALHARQDLDTLIAQRGMAHRDAAGDMAADLIGIDIGM